MRSEMQALEGWKCCDEGIVAVRQVTGSGN